MGAAGTAHGPDQATLFAFDVGVDEKKDGESHDLKSGAPCI